MKTITIISLGNSTCRIFCEQLRHLLGHNVMLCPHAKEDGWPERITGDVVLLTTSQLLPEVQPLIDDMRKVVITRRSINYHELYKLFQIPAGTDVLLVNDMASTANETIAMLRMLNIGHLNYHPYYPGLSDYPRLQIAVTPGEVQCVPKFVREIVDIHSRPIDITSIVEMLTQLDLIDVYGDMLSSHYVRDIIELMCDNSQMMLRGNRLQSQMRAIINAVHDGIVSTDEKNIVSVFNPVAEDIFGLPADVVVNHPLSEHERLAVLQGESCSVDKELFRVFSDKQVVLNVEDIPFQDGKAGKLYTLKHVSEIRRLEESARRTLKNEHNTARYTFADVIGTSATIRECVSMAQHMTHSESTVLIEGETGTGKEVFAQSIHNASSRRDEPFVAINVAAMTESLLESELFGYKPGAFTGATRSGSIGLFEAAHKGTLFLDEVGDVPLGFQVKLLRVLQERQIKKVGSTRMMPVDVRVIAATNQNLKEFIEQGRFRKDLFYRLNVLPLRLPPLRERPQDILPIAERMYARLTGREANGFFEHVLAVLCAYSWPGNIRELHNVVEFLVNVSPESPPHPDRLPLDLLVEPQAGNRQDVVCVLAAIVKAHEQGETVGRRSLALRTRLPESRIRKALASLAEEGSIRIERGRGGIALLST